MNIKDRLIYYSRLVGPNGERLATLFRFQTRPTSDHPQIYRRHDSLLNHKSRLVRETWLWLSDIVTPDDILEIQHILICHDVQELMDGDVNRFEEVEVEQIGGTDQLLLPEDATRYKGFLSAQKFLENGTAELPTSPHALLARVLDTIDGNYFAFAMLENYATKVGGETPDPNLQKALDRSYGYVNKIRLKYKDRIALTVGQYNLDLVTILNHLQEIEKEKLDKFSRSIEEQGYRISKIV